MTESISFPESYIPQIVRLIYRGLKDEEDPEVIEQLELQCLRLTAYYSGTETQD